MSVNKKLYPFFQGESPAHIVKYLINNGGADLGVYKFLYRDNDSVMKLQTIIAGETNDQNGNKMIFINQFTPEVITKNGADVVVAHFEPDIKNQPTTQAGGAMFVHQFKLPKPIGYFNSGPFYGRLSPIPVGHPMVQLVPPLPIVSLVSYQKEIHEFKIDKIECESCKSLDDKGQKDKVRNAVKQVFKERYDSSNIEFYKIGEVSICKDDDLRTTYTVTVYYTKKSFPVGIVTKYKSKTERIKEIRELVNEKLSR